MFGLLILLSVGSAVVFYWHDKEKNKKIREKKQKREKLLNDVFSITGDRRVRISEGERIIY